MKNHATRFRLLSIGLLTSVLIWLGLTIGSVWEATLMESTIYSVASATSVLLLAAWLDALGVEKRRKTPGAQAVEDDIPPSDPQ